MAANTGVFSISPNFFTVSSLSLSRRVSAFYSNPLLPSEYDQMFSFRASSARHCLSRDSRVHSPFSPHAIATQSSLLSEEAFKEMGGFKDSFENDKFQFGEKGLEGNNDELDVSRLGLPEQLVHTLQKRGITNLFPIQRAVFASAVEGRDIIARAKTGTGKTLAFGIPILKRLTEDNEDPRKRASRLPRVLVLAPTRELAKQVEKEIKESAPYLNTVCVYGGVSYNVQQNSLSQGVDVVVGTPGRIIDLINGNSLQLGEVQYLILDEADRMLAVGFEEDVEVILQKLPTKRQNMLFSATMPGWVNKLARKYLDNPLTIDLVGNEEEKLAEGIKLYAVSITLPSKRTVLSDLIMVHAKGGKTIVFTQTKSDADEVSQALANTIPCEALHGNISQYQRERTLNGFRQGKFGVLVATDVASRGLDIPNVDLIIHYELPNDPETFVHRSGRTGRAGKEGTAILMFTNNQRRTIKSLEHDIGCRFEFISPPQTHEVLESSSEQVIAMLQGVHSESIRFFLPSAQKLIEERGADALAAALAHLSGFSKPPSARSLVSHEQGWVTLQLTRVPGYSRGFFTARSVTGFLSDVCPIAADEVGKILLVADESIQGAVFDLPEEIAKQLLSKQLPSGNTLMKISKLPALQDDGPPGDFYGRSYTNERGLHGSSRDGFGSRGGFRGGTFRGQRSTAGRGYDGGDEFQRGGRGYRAGSNNWSKSSVGSEDDDADEWQSSGRRFSNKSTFGSRERHIGGICFKCGQTGHRASDCPSSRGY